MPDFGKQIFRIFREHLVILNPGVHMNYINRLTSELVFNFQTSSRTDGHLYQ